MTVYNPADNYWLVGNRADVVFASARAVWVPPTDTAYEAWLAAGELPSRVAADGELAHLLVLAKFPTIAAAVGATSLSTLSPGQMIEIVTGLGVALTSTGTPALNATYALSGQAWQDMRDEAQYVQTYGAFSGDAETLTWPETVNGVPVTFATTAQFLAVVRALADYLTSWKRYLAAGGTQPTLGSVTTA